MANIEENLRKVLNKIATENQFQNYEIILNENSSGGANYTSKLFTVIISETNRDDLHLFAKCVIVGEKFRNNFADYTAFDTEVTAYKKLCKIYKSLEKENDLPEEYMLFFTKYYGFDPTLYQEILVLENLIVQGYSCYTRFKSIDWEYASAAITELAKMHALSFAHSEKNPVEFENILTDIKLAWKEGAMDSMTQGSVVTALKSVRPEYREALEKFLETSMKDLLVRFYAPIHRVVIVHGDFRVNNLLHRVREVNDLEHNIQNTLK